jgi:signal transduction histidine kinase
MIFKKIFEPIQWLARISSSRVEVFGAQYVLFGLFGLFNYPLSFLYLYYVGSQRQESLFLRVLAMGLCIPLVLKPFWPEAIKKYLPLYWHLTLCYSIPVLGAYGLLNNGMSIEWMINLATGIFLFVLLVDWTTFAVIYSFGFCVGISLVTATNSGIISNPSSDGSWSLAFYLYGATISIGCLFGRNRERVNEARLQAAKSLAYSIAHEMRTPLATIAAGATNLGKYLPIYDDAYLKAQKAGLPVANIDGRIHKLLIDIPSTMEKVSYNAQNIINMLLVKVQDTKKLRLQPCSMAQCIGSALEQYPFRNDEKSKIIVMDNLDFIFDGKEELFVYVLFNLIKNSLHQISFVNNGTIHLRWSQNETYNFLYFSDNGNGIPKKIIGSIFDRFITGTDNGTGMGLAFCKMVMSNFGGNIECHSKEGNGAEFIMSFPKVSKEEDALNHLDEGCIDY